MKKGTIALIAILAAVAIFFMWYFGVRNKLVAAEENVNNAWGNVETVYQRRADLIPQLVNTVKGASNYEQETFLAVTEARSKAVNLTLTGDQLTEENVANFQKVQDELKNELTKAINLTVERYPELTATESYKNLMTQLEGTENRISVERKNFNDAVKDYNKSIRMFPASIVANMSGFEKKGYFAASQGADQAPVVNFE
ncbi:MAG: LemA family protein [Bacteroidales bacterium]|jgi:LemA protein|nr:LemA family protein [Bacteroidales bacterium]